MLKATCVLIMCLEVANCVHMLCLCLVEFYGMCDVCLRCSHDSCLLKGMHAYVILPYGA
jgi:hypothetical protein